MFQKIRRQWFSVLNKQQNGKKKKSVKWVGFSQQDPEQKVHGSTALILTDGRRVENSYELNWHSQKDCLYLGDCFQHAGDFTWRELTPSKTNQIQTNKKKHYLIILPSEYHRSDMFSVQDLCQITTVMSNTH